MNRKWLAIIGIVSVLAVFGLACSPYGTNVTGDTSNLQLDVKSQQEGIWVSGEGKVSAVPDIAILQLGVEAQAATVAEAQSQASQAMEQVMTSLTGNGIAERDIQTQFFSISKVTRWDESSQQEIVLGYRVTNMVTAKIRDIEKSGTVIDAVALAGGDSTRINSIYFSVEDPTSYQRDARNEAMADAKSKAEQLASLAGVNLGKPVYISESFYSPVSPIYRDLSEGASAPATPISPGELEITLNVQVVYTILD